ncbi:unnamed protein product [Cladocopium goreaui]|uniref:Dynein axonemal heavy chain 3 (Axonemal beta dynein heavy chain 3) (HsADHC3) (Ciliary dynein heavy chain 3) (Dnahc3-b) n=1 Tax=Cladocopium goreaui TaxID=2562237 RepID=A0A9P1C6K7_9DINO|nr:unnamed protein product [Cladocopium goreaui]
MAMPKETHMSIQIGFSAQTKCSQTQDLIDAKLERRRKGVYGPPMGGSLALTVQLCPAFGGTRNDSVIFTFPTSYSTTKKVSKNTLSISILTRMSGSLDFITSLQLL